MIKTLWFNLSRAQKIGVVVLVQIIVIITLVVLVNTFVTEKQHVFLNESSDSSVDGGIPSNAKDFIGDTVWQVVKKNVPGVADNNINDMVIRDGTYEEIDNGDGTVGVSFIVDIDSLRQTYVIKTGWAKNGSVVYEVVVDCPPIEQMKYPETVCKGMYNTTASLDLYLPHDITDDDTEDGVLWAYIYGNEYEHTIDVEMAPCDLDATRKKVDDYLGSLPIDMNEYKVNYLVLKSDVDCEYKTTLMEEYDDGEE